jgi:hypothetical protein
MVAIHFSITFQIQWGISPTTVSKNTGIHFTKELTIAIKFYPDRYSLKQVDLKKGFNLS